jgi:hypothetical protein
MCVCMYVCVYVCMYACMYEFYSFSPHNGITITNELILRFSPVNDNSELLLLYKLSYFVFCYKFFDIVSFYVLVLTL